MLNKVVVPTLAVVMLSAFSLTACADSKEEKSNHSKHHARPFKVALWGDEFYNKDEQGKEKDIAQTVASINKHRPAFTIFVGDSKNGSSECSDKAIGDNIVEVFNQIKAPTIYSLGDNEWTDCHRTNNGSYEPLERLAFLRDTFFNDNYSQGLNPLKVERQAEVPENSYFEKNKVSFVALNVVGSNNNLVVTEKQCFSKSDRTLADCAAASAEYEARNERNIEWLKEAFDKAKENKNVGIVIAIQADVYRVNVGEDYKAFLQGLTKENGFTDFFNTLVAETHHFPGQVVLVHGDSHYFRIDKAMFNKDGSITKNFTRVEVFGSKENDWVEMRVEPQSKHVFSFKPVMLED